jgi:hypothetical protein
MRSSCVCVCWIVPRVILVRLESSDSSRWPGVPGFPLCLLGRKKLRVVSAPSQSVSRLLDDAGAVRSLSFAPLRHPRSRSELHFLYAAHAVY